MRLHFISSKRSLKAMLAKLEAKAENADKPSA
jgi:hypothetical protein